MPVTCAGVEPAEVGPSHRMSGRLLRSRAVGSEPWGLTVNARDRCGLSAWE